MESNAKDAAWWTEWHLENWARWMHTRDLPDILPSEASGGAENYTTYDANSERARAVHDVWAAENTDAVIAGLPDAEQMAIHHAYLNAIYRFLRGNYAELLERARAGVMAGLKRRGVWLGE